jgi:hypothetical protein
VRIGAAILALAGCNALYGLEGTEQRTADARAPYRCPTDGSPPQFSTQLHQVMRVTCYSYTFSESTDIALYDCVQPIEEGSIDARGRPFAPIELAPTTPSPGTAQDPRITPDGERLFVRQVYDVDQSYETVYRREGDRWVDPVDIDTNTYSEYFGLPSAVPDRRVIKSAGATFVEYVEQPDRTWSEVASYPSAPLRTNRPLSLSPDGLSVIFLRGQTLAYSRRASTSDPFASYVDVPGVPSGVGTPFMTADCGRLYFSALGSIWYAEQL